MQRNDLYLTLNPRERVELLDTASRKRGLATPVLEKDYWVCKTLDVLFNLAELGPHLIFKGGTSLSKVYRLIERFSEDVDVSLHRAYLGFGHDRDPETSQGKEQRRRLQELEQACRECVRSRLLPAFREAMAESLRETDSWSAELDPADPQTILFRYPQAGDGGPSYITPAVRIELGARSDHWPAEKMSITTYLSDTLDRSLGGTKVRALAAERTFWEKATLLHAEAHRTPDKPMPARYARHYYDLACLALSPVAERALADGELRQRVVEHKSVYFRSAWARYDLAHPATFRLLPPSERLSHLKQDHQQMEPMFFSTPPTLENILKTLDQLEQRIRQLTT